MKGKNMSTIAPLRTVRATDLATPSMRDWLDLMVRAETIHETYGIGLASVWDSINARDYDAAREVLQCITALIEEGYFYREASSCTREGCDSPLHRFFA